MDLQLMVYRVEYRVYRVEAVNDPSMDLQFMLVDHGRSSWHRFLVVIGAKIQVFHEKEPANIGWGIATATPTRCMVSSSWPARREDQ